MPWDDDITWHHQFDMRCDIDDLVEEYLGALSRSVLIDIPHEGPYLVEPSRSSGSAASLVILGCEADDECTRESYGFHMGDQEVTGFVPGRYEVVVTERSGSVKEVDSSVEVVITAL